MQPVPISRRKDCSLNRGQHVLPALGEIYRNFVNQNIINVTIDPHSMDENSTTGLENKASESKPYYTPITHRETKMNALKKRSKLDSKNNAKSR